MEDADLVRLCQQGDMAAFEQLFHRHKEQIYGLAYRMINSEQDAMDLTQEIFIKAYRKIGRFNFSSAFSTWLHRLAVNHCIDELRKRKHSLKTAPLEEARLETDSKTPEDEAVLMDTERAVWEAINSLKEKQKAIIILRDIEGFSYKDISEITGYSMGRVKSRIHEARQELRRALEARNEQWDLA